VDLLLRRPPAGATPDDGLWRVELRNGDNSVVASAPALAGGGTYPPSRWRPGEMMRSFGALRLPATLASGLYTLTVQPPAGAALPLGPLEVQGRPRTFDAPLLAHSLEADFGGRVRLLGLGAGAALTATAGAPWTLDLVWQPIAAAQEDGGAPLVRFVQLLDAGGSVRAQQDTIPCAGDCPSSGWVEGEVLTDRASMVLPAELSPGPYTLLVGWYDGVTLERLPATAPDGTPLADAVVRLPVAVVAP
jgi:hypothetical protein